MPPEFIYKEEKKSPNARPGSGLGILPASEKSLVKFLAGLESGMLSIHSTSSLSICTVSPIIFFPSYRSIRISSSSDRLFVTFSVTYCADDRQGSFGSCCRPISLATQSRTESLVETIRQVDDRPCDFPLFQINSEGSRQNKEKKMPENISEIYIYIRMI